MSRKELSDEEVAVFFASITATLKSIVAVLDRVIATNELMAETLRSLADLYDPESTKEEP